MAYEQVIHVTIYPTISKYSIVVSTDVEAVLVEYDERHGGVQQPRGVSDVDGRLLLVARQHPHVDVGLQQRRYRLGDSVLHGQSLLLHYYTESTISIPCFFKDYILYGFCQKICEEELSSSIIDYTREVIE